MALLSDIYDVVPYKIENMNSIRGVANIDYVRPTITEFFTSARNIIKKSFGDVYTYSGSSTRKTQMSSSICRTSGSYGVETLFDGINGGYLNCWFSSIAPNTDGSCWVEIDLLERKRVNGFRMRRRNDTPGGSEDFPKNMKVSIDGELSDVTYTNNNASLGSWANWITLNTPLIGRHFRIEIHSKYTSGASDPYVSIADMQYSIQDQE